MHHCFFSCIQRVALIVTILGGFAPDEVLSREATDADVSNCGGVEVRVAGSEFEDALSIEYELHAADGLEEFCVPEPISRQGEFTDVSMLELRHDASVWNDAESLSQSALFVENLGDWYFKALVPSTHLVSLPVGPRKHEIPPGRYRLVLRYLNGPCAGTFAEESCIAVSSAFDLKSSVTIVTTDRRPESD